LAARDPGIMAEQAGETPITTHLSKTPKTISVAILVTWFVSVMMLGLAVQHFVGGA
jgi:hypothetical protein